MKTWMKLIIAAVIGFVVSWLCYQVFHLEQTVTTVVTIIVTLAVYSICNKVKNNDA